MQKSHSDHLSPKKFNADKRLEKIYQFSKK